MTNVPPAQQCVLPDCTRAARDPSREGAVCSPHLEAMVNGTLADLDTGDDEPFGASGDDDPIYTSLNPGLLDIDIHGINRDTYPTDLVDGGSRWLLWQESDGRKVPRNPRWGRPEDVSGYAFVAAKNPDAWYEFRPANAWTNHDPDLGLAYYLAGPDRTDWDDDPDYEALDPEADIPDEPHVGLLDFDDVRDPETGEVAPAAAALLDKLASTFCEWSPSGTGAHALGGFRLPEDVTTLTLDLSSEGWPDAELELYPGHRYTTVTGDHIPGTATSTSDIQGVVDEILSRYPGAVDAAKADAPAARPDAFDATPELSEAELEEMDSTDDIQDIFDAIQHTEPSDIRLRSTVTRDHGDGSKDLDPCWANSESGTRLAQVDDGWVYRKGMSGSRPMPNAPWSKRSVRWSPPRHGSWPRRPTSRSGMSEKPFRGYLTRATSPVTELPGRMAPMCSPRPMPRRVVWRSWMWKISRTAPHGAPIRGRSRSRRSSCPGDGLSGRVRIRNRPKRCH